MVSAIPCVVISLPASERSPVRPQEIPLADWGLWLMNADEVMVICSGSRDDVLSAAVRLRDDLDAVIAGRGASRSHG